MLIALCTTSVGIVACSGSNQQAAHDDTVLTSKTPYQPRQDVSAYTPVPAGYQIVMLQHVARHGSRGLSSADDDDLMLQLWQQAEAEDALTSLGEQLKSALDAMLNVHKRLGYGEISTLGRQEHAQMASRIVQRHEDLFSAEVDPDRSILVTHSGRSRAAQSGEAFVAQLVAEQPHLAARIQPAYASPETVYFHKAEGSEGYDDYRDNDPRLVAAMAQIEAGDKTRRVAEEALSRLFTDDFVARLQAGQYSFSAHADDEDQINDELDALFALHGLYSIAPNLTADADIDMTPFLLPEHASWLAYVDDADSFYGRGPGFVGEDITYRAADALFMEMFAQIDEFQRASSSAPLASLRFTHAQVTMPIATWLQLADTENSVEPDTLYTYETNPWRAAVISPMSANVQWEIYATDMDSELLVRMLHNEAEVPFPAECSALESGSYFYPYSEIKRCLGEIHNLEFN
ncbi:histidine-type phosphatase [Aliidiomarina sedimenti]|uniref:Multiple inositol polyphosphate phosphatase 1 n=2 Tax=Aliidiomarina sedimenti TaxID=1933879 RepID=A0ABY0C199_9GAMM|nr:histidine-type phosphatase [Aliidiomarina sedimenti]